MDGVIIAVPDLNDSFSRIVLDGKAYLIRFTYNHSLDYWTFGLYTVLKEPIIQYIKIVPNYLLTRNYTVQDLPNGYFFALSGKERIGKNDFKSGVARFLYLARE